MSRIRILDDTLIDQIAAGEVVERPASVVKELVENALDASATRIDVTITDGGLRWICVTDNGVGMSGDDAALALQRHATSKLRSLDDLERIGTMGFRGEALPSIASVSELRLRTRTVDDSIGTEVMKRSESATTLEVSQVACNLGTRVEVAHLFARVPARRKFLKSPVTETSHITRLLERLALARPDIRLSLARDGKNALLFLPTEDLRERLSAVLPASVGERLLAFAAQSALGKVHGFAAPTDLTRGNANDIYLFVNGRAVRDRLLLFAVRHAYRDALPPGRHPIAVLYLETDPNQVDVNVHPTKAEVRFRDSEAIRQLVSHAIVSAIGAPGSSTRRDWPSVHDPIAAVRDAQAPPDRMLWEYAHSSQRRIGETLSESLSADVSSLADPAERPRSTWGDAPIAVPERQGASSAIRFSEHRVIGQLLGTYLVLERPGYLVLVDQHAAHERVLFERLRAALRDDALERQVLLIPVWLELPQSTADALEMRQEALERAGYELELAGRAVRGGVKVAIKAVPAVLKSMSGSKLAPDWAALLEETASGSSEASSETARTGIDGALHHVLATAACHAACRKGDRLSTDEIRGLLRDLDELVWFPNCPHGRPIAYSVSEGELERRFLRS